MSGFRNSFFKPSTFRPTPMRMREGGSESGLFRPKVWDL